MKKLRLLLFETCFRNCSGCVNNDFDLSTLPVETDFSQYDKIILTGGEPMLNPISVVKTANLISRTSNADVYLYTAMITDFMTTLWVLTHVAGLTVTLHEPSDIGPFINLNNALSCLYEEKFANKSLRLNVLEGVDINPDDYPLWKIKSNIRWVKDCPLPQDEVFKRLNPPRQKEIKAA